jgi:hypothetical protein
LKEDSAEEGTRQTLREYVERCLPDEMQKKISTLNLNFKYEIPKSGKRFKEMSWTSVSKRWCGALSQMKTLRRFYRLWWTCDGVKS